MIEKKIESYGGFTLLNLYCDEETLIDREQATYIRVMTPAVYGLQNCMSNQGFFYADRILKSSINLRRSVCDYEKMVRAKVKKTDEYREDILRIAKKSFPVDRRFNVAKDYNPQIASTIIESWVDRINEFFVCYYKSDIVGFAGLEKTEQEGFYEIGLAAVDEKYRLSGIAMSLYASVVNECIAMHGRCLYGWISTVNTAVMNLYAALGAVFSEPHDIYLG